MTIGQNTGLSCRAAKHGVAGTTFRQGGPSSRGHKLRAGGFDTVSENSPGRLGARLPQCADRHLAHVLKLRLFYVRDSRGRHGRDVAASLQRLFAVRCRDAEYGLRGSYGGLSLILPYRQLDASSDAFRASSQGLSDVGFIWQMNIILSPRCGCRPADVYYNVGGETSINGVNQGNAANMLRLGAGVGLSVWVGGDVILNYERGPPNRPANRMRKLSE